MAIDYYSEWEKGNGGRVIESIQSDIHAGMSEDQLEHKYGLGVMCRYAEGMARLGLRNY